MVNREDHYFYFYSYFINEYKKDDIHYSLVKASIKSSLIKDYNNVFI